MDEMEHASDKIVPILMEEYKSLRQESLSSITNRNQIMGLTLTALSVVISFTSISEIPDLLAATVLMLLVPGISKVVTLIWLGEYQRSKRAGAAIEQIENTINTLMKFRALTWENDLSKKGIAMIYQYLPTFAVLLGTGYMSILISFFFLLRSISDLSLLQRLIFMLFLLAIVLAVEIWFVVWLKRRWSMIRTQFHEMFAPDVHH